MSAGVEKPDYAFYQKRLIGLGSLKHSYGHQVDSDLNKNIKQTARICSSTIFTPEWLILILCAAMAAHLLLRTPSFPYTPDSASYFEQARNLVQTGKALETPYGLGKAAQQLSVLFPIGYPLVLAFFSFLGVEPREAALVLSSLAGLLLPVLLFIGFRRTLGGYFSVLLAILTVTSPGVLSFSTLGTSDLLALLLSVITISTVLNASSRPLLMFGGLMAGCAYAIRNAQLALLLAIINYYLYFWLTRPTERRRTTQDALIFLIGVSLVLIPVLCRNQMLFGALNPYQMEPSTVSAIHNVRTFVQEMSYDLSGMRSLGIFLGWSLAGAIFLVAFMTSFAWLMMTSWQELTASKQNTIFLCASYAAIGACMVVAARSRYEWGEMINIRHTLQYTPFIWAALIGLLPISHKRLHNLPFLRIAGLLLVLIGAFHVIYALKPQDLLLRSQKSEIAINAYENGKDFLCQPGNTGITASNWGYIFRIQCGATTRNIEMEKFPCIQASAETLKPNDCGIADAALAVAKNFSGQPVKMGFFVGRGVVPRQLPLSQNDRTKLEDIGLHVIRNDAQGVLLINQPTP